MLRAALGLLLTAAACQATPAPVAEPPADLFPAPPGFAGVETGPGAWRFSGHGRVADLAAFFRDSCVDLYDWRPLSIDEQPDGGWRLTFERDGRTLRVHVLREGDTLTALATVEPPPDRGRASPEPAPDRR